MRGKGLSIWWLFPFLVVFFYGIYIFKPYILPPSLPKEVAAGGELRVLLIYAGRDNLYGASLLLYNPKGKSIGILSIPQSTLIERELRGEIWREKLEDVYRMEGVRKVVAEIGNMVGIKIQKYVVLNREKLGYILQAVFGGMDYVCTEGVRFFSGREISWHLFSVDDELEFSRRSASLLLTLFLHLALDREGILPCWYFKKLISTAFLKNILSGARTNFNSHELKLLLEFMFKNLNSYGISQKMMPGSFQLIEGIYYFVPRVVHLPYIMKKLRNPKPVSLKIRILDGVIDRKFIRQVKKYLTEKGYDIIGVEKARQRYDKTYVVVYSQSPGSVKKLLLALGLGKGMGYPMVKVDPDRINEVDLIIGRDYLVFWSGNTR